MKNRIILTNAMKIQSAFLSGHQKFGCIYWQRERFPTKSDKVTDINAPKEILKSYLCCYLCLKTEHLSKKCTKKYISQI